VVACIASSDWFRLTRHFKNHLVVRYALDGSKLVYSVLIALSPELRREAGSVSWWQTLKETLLPFTDLTNPKGSLYNITLILIIFIYLIITYYLFIFPYTK
jgi:hypothetical protein